MIYNSYGPNTILKCIYIPLGIMSLKAACILFLRRRREGGSRSDAIQQTKQNQILPEEQYCEYSAAVCRLTKYHKYSMTYGLAQRMHQIPKRRLAIHAKDRR